MEKDDVFEKEFIMIENTKETLKQELSCEKIKNNFEELIQKYEKLLNNTSKITKISDRLYKKLANANDIIEEQKEKLTTINEELVQAQKAVTKEVKKIVQIQQSLLPYKMPEDDNIEGAAYYRASLDAGGDYYDIIKIDDDKYGICIADVSGHGVHAAVIMAMTRMGVNICAKQEETPLQFMNRLDAILNENIRTGDFVSLFYGILDFNKNKFIFANGGHPPFFHFSKETMEIKEIETGKGHLLGLGIFEDDTFTEDSIEVKNGDVLIFFTDGIVEAMNKEREQYGYDRLKISIKKSGISDIKEMIKNTIEAVEDFAEKKEFSDDITMIAVKIKRIEINDNEKIDS